MRKIYRIWSTEWYQNRDHSIKGVLKAIEELKNPTIISEETKKSDELNISSEIVKPTSLEDSIPQYKIYNSLNLEKNCELHEKSTSELSVAITEIVDYENPIHINEVIKRIRTYWGLKGAGKRIQDNIQQAALIAKQKGDIEIKNDFLYSKTNEIQVRIRNNDYPANIDMISPDEIEKAIKMVINAQFATAPNDLVTQVSENFWI